MVHYPRIISFVGPLIGTWCMRFEGKHRPLKTTSIISNNKKNIPFTLAIKSQLKLAFRLISLSGFSNIFKHSSIHFIENAIICEKFNSNSESNIIQQVE